MYRAGRPVYLDASSELPVYIMELLNLMLPSRPLPALGTCEDMSARINPPVGAGASMGSKPSSKHILVSTVRPRKKSNGTLSGFATITP